MERGQVGEFKEGPRILTSQCICIVLPQIMRQGLDSHTLYSAVGFFFFFFIIALPDPLTHSSINFQTLKLMTGQKKLQWSPVLRYVVVRIMHIYSYMMVWPTCIEI